MGLAILLLHLGVVLALRRHEVVLEIDHDDRGLLGLEDLVERRKLRQLLRAGERGREKHEAERHAGRTADVVSHVVLPVSLPRVYQICPAPGSTSVTVNSPALSATVKRQGGRGAGP